MGKCASTGRQVFSVPIGSLVVIRPNISHRDVICCTRDKDLTIQDVMVYYGTGRAILTNFVENFVLDNAGAQINEDKGRIFSTEQDNYHSNNCRGTIVVKNCAPTGMGDDAINIHGRYFRVNQVVSHKTAIINIPDAHPSVGETMWLVRQSDMARVASSTITDIQDIGTLNGILTAKVTFDKSINFQMQAGDYLESKTWTADVEISGCHFQRKNRARGVLVTSPGKVYIHDNTFQTAGAAIQINGDVKEWLEAGACNNVRIEHNTFDHCLTSGTTSNGWGGGVITIVPETPDRTFFHQNIVIENNTFRDIGMPLVFARSVNGLTFGANVVYEADITPCLELVSCKSVVFNKSTAGSFRVGCTDMTTKNITWK